MALGNLLPILEAGRGRRSSGIIRIETYRSVDDIERYDEGSQKKKKKKKIMRREAQPT